MLIDYRSKGIRLFNLLFDLFFVSALIVPFVVNPFIEHFNYAIDVGPDTNILVRYRTAITIIIYYIIMEYLTGRTVSKFITQTRVVNLDGTKPTFFTIVSRTLIRCIPLVDLFSFLGENGWHDSKSYTKVIVDPIFKFNARIKIFDFGKSIKYILAVVFCILLLPIPD